MLRMVPAGLNGRYAFLSIALALMPYIFVATALLSLS